MTKPEALAYIQQVWEGHEKATPIRNKQGVALATERWPMTIPHAQFDEVMDHVDPKGDNPDWEYVRALRGDSGGTISREYPGAYVKAILDALKGGKPTKEG